jgi:hypothetical protein
VRLLVVSVCVASAVALVPSVAESRPAEAANPFVESSRSAQVYLVPLDAHARQLLRSVLPVLNNWLPSGTEITVIPSAGAKWVNAARGGERNGVAITSDLYARFRQAQGGRLVLLMAVTSEAVYDPAMPQLNFVFGLFQTSKTGASAVFGTRPMRVYQPTRERVRLTKMMLRYIGQIWCGLPRNTNPRSVLYTPLLGTDDLDRMLATLPARCRQ